MPQQHAVRRRKLTSERNLNKSRFQLSGHSPVTTRTTLIKSWISRKLNLTQFQTRWFRLSTVVCRKSNLNAHNLQAVIITRRTLKLFQPSDSTLKLNSPYVVYLILSQLRWSRGQSMKGSGWMECEKDLGSRPGQMAPCSKVSGWLTSHVGRYTNDKLL